MAITIRTAQPDDIELLKEALHISVVWDADEPSSLEQAVGHPELLQYWENWGRRGDLGVVAERDGHYLGAAFGRLFTEDRPSYGFVDELTPEVGIGIIADERGKGLGRQMMLQLEDLYREFGSSRLSLSVNFTNPARHLYESLGYTEVGQDENSAQMVKVLH
ncbi:MAG: GNAT family N-acetyltransferase [Acidimicrobiia bacterium]